MSASRLFQEIKDALSDDPQLKCRLEEKLVMLNQLDKEIFKVIEKQCHEIEQL